MYPKVEEFCPLSGYSYSANNPVLLPYVNGKDWTITKDEDENGHVIIRAHLGVYGKANKIGGKEVAVAFGKVSNMVNEKDVNTLSHEFGHTLGLLHPDEWATRLDGLVPGHPNQYMNSSQIKNERSNVMYSNDKVKVNDGTSTTVTKDQLQAIYRIYSNGGLNKK